MPQGGKLARPGADSSARARRCLRIEHQRLVPEGVDHRQAGRIPGASGDHPAWSCHALQFGRHAGLVGDEHQQQQRQRGVEASILVRQFGRIGTVETEARQGQARAAVTDKFKRQVNAGDMASWECRIECIAHCAGAAADIKNAVGATDVAERDEGRRQTSAPPTHKAFVARRVVERLDGFRHRAPAGMA